MLLALLLLAPLLPGFPFCAPLMTGPVTVEALLPPELLPEPPPVAPPATLATLRPVCASSPIRLNAVVPVGLSSNASLTASWATWSVSAFFPSASSMFPPSRFASPPEGVDVAR